MIAQGKCKVMVGVRVMVKAKVRVKVTKKVGGEG